MVSGPVDPAVLPAIIDYATAHPVSTAVNFFRSYPRIGARTVFADTPSYTRSLALILVPYASAALLVALLSLLAFALSQRRTHKTTVQLSTSSISVPSEPESAKPTPPLPYSTALHNRQQDEPLPTPPQSPRRSTSANSSPPPLPNSPTLSSHCPPPQQSPSSAPPRRDTVDTVYLLFSAVLNLALYAAATLAVCNLLAFRAAVATASDAVSAAVVAAHTSLITPASVLLRLSRGAAAAQPDFTNLRYLSEASRHLSTLRHHGLAQAAAAHRLEPILHRLGRLVSLPAIGLAVLAVLGGAFALGVDRAPRMSRRRTRIALFLLAVPSAMAAWLLAGVCAAGAVATADLCVAVSGFQSWVTSSRGVPQGTENLFTGAGLACSNASRLVDMAVRLIDTPAAKSEDFTADLHALLKEMNTSLPREGEQWPETRELLVQGLTDARRCGFQRRLAGQLSFSLCSARSVAAMSTLTQAWLVACALSLLYLMIMLLPAAQHPIAEHVSAVELLRLAGKGEYYRMGEDAGRGAGANRGGAEHGMVGRSSSAVKRSEWSAEESTWSMEDGLFIETDLDADVSSTVFDEARHMGQIAPDDGILTTGGDTADEIISPAPP